VQLRPLQARANARRLTVVLDASGANGPIKAGHRAGPKQGKDYNMSDNTEKKRPTHAIFAVTGEGEKAYWLRIGAAFAHKDGKGSALVLDAIPLTGRIVMREITDAESFDPR
jgi:hypothetical protein